MTAKVPKKKRATRAPKKGEAPRYDLSIFQSLRQIIRALDIHSRKLSSVYGITGPQLLCLQTIAAEGPLTQLALSQRVHLSASTVVGILDRLEHKQLVKRERDTKDRRRIFVGVTAAGRKLLTKAPSPLQDALAAALSDIGELEQATIALSLRRVVELLDVGHIDAAPILEAGPISGAQTDS